jgi:hypothetical protein
VPAGVVAISWLSFVVMFCCRVGARWRDRVLCVHRPSRAARFLHDAAIGGFQSIGIVTGLTTHSTRPLPAVAIPAASRGALIQTLGITVGIVCFVVPSAFVLHRLPALLAWRRQTPWRCIQFVRVFPAVFCVSPSPSISASHSRRFAHAPFYLPLRFAWA